MRIIDLITKKRDGAALETEEITWLIQSYINGLVPDYQMAAWLMAVFFRGMTETETAALTMAMAQSGDILDLSDIPGIKVDKHSTGGVADTTTLILGPLVAAAGVPVAKMSGRGLGFTGGTIDKLEAIPGFITALSRQTFISNLKSHGLVITAQSSNIAPADGMIYSLRDVTGTVESIPLIASSIMSKKIAAGADKIVLDVKVGNGAFMKTFDDALTLARIMVGIGHIVNRETVAVLTNMEQPLGNAVGNSLEVCEAIDMLSGQGSDELRRVCLVLGAHILLLAGKVSTFDDGYQLLNRLLENGSGLEKFAEFIKAQGGDPAVIEKRELLPLGKYSADVKLGLSGYIERIEAARIGYASVLLGAGRMYKNQPLDLGAGIIIHHRIGDYVYSEDRIATIYCNDPPKIAEAIKHLSQAFVVGDKKPSTPKLILGVVEHDKVEIFD